jgi:hypothetical protein
MKYHISLNGKASRLLAPLVDALGRYVLAANKAHIDDTSVRVLYPGLGQHQDRAVVDLRAR